jgi:hypothetical protein
MLKMRLILSIYLLSSFFLTLFAQKKAELKDFNDTILNSFNKTILSNIELSSTYSRILLAENNVAKTASFLYVTNAENGSKTRLKTLVLNDKFEILAQKESSFNTFKGKLEASEMIDLGDELAVFNIDAFYIEELNISKKDGSVVGIKPVDPKLLSKKRVFKHENKLYLLTFDNKDYILYSLAHNKILKLGEGKIPQIPKFKLEKRMEEAVFIRSYKATSFDKASSNDKVFTFDDKIVFTFDNIQKTSAEWLTIAFDLNTGNIEKTIRTYPSVFSLENKRVQYGSYLTSDKKVFLGAISDREFKISIQNLNDSIELKSIKTTIRDGISFRNSAIYDDKANFNMWSGKLQRKALDTLSEKKFWELVLNSGLGIMAIPTKNGYDVTCGNYVFRENNDDAVAAAGVMFGLVGAVVASAANGGRGGAESQYFYSHFNDKFDSNTDVELPNDWLIQYKTFDYNNHFKYRMAFKMNDKNVFCIYQPNSKKLMFVSE